jgi:hypothetical protein
MRVRVPHALIHEIAEAALTHVLEKSPRQIAPELIDGNLQDKSGRTCDRFVMRQRRLGSMSAGCDAS